jgi:diguanylate cyclase (GGDEF)-like protein/PAS domain S-box-containing protein
MEQSVNNPDPRILGKILLLQSTLHAMPSDVRMGEFLCRGVFDIPGVSAVKLYLDNELISTYPEHYQENSDTVDSLALQTTLSDYGELVCYLDRLEIFEPYRPHLENTVNLVSLVLENRQQELRLLKFNTELELRVREQTQTLIQANEALFQSEEKQRLLLNSTAEAIYALDLNGNCTFCNTSFIKQLGYDDASELLGKNMHELIHHTTYAGRAFPEEDCPIYQSLSQDKEVHEIDDIFWRKDGTSTTVEYWSHPIRSHGEIVGAVVTVIENTKRKEYEEQKYINQRRALRQDLVLTKIFTNEIFIKNELEDALRIITELIADAMEIERVSIWHLSDDQKELNCENLYKQTPDKHSQGQVLSSKQYPDYFNAVQTARTIDASDACNDPRTRELKKDYLLPLSVSSLLDAGIWVEGKLIGVICFEHVGTQRHWTSDEKIFAGKLADQIAQAIVNRKRQQAEKQLKESELKFKKLVDNLPGTIYRRALDSDWTINFISDEIESMSGYPASGFLNNRTRTFASIIFEDDRAFVEKIVLAGVNNNKPYQLEYRIISADGNIHWIYEKGQAITGPDNEVLYLDGALFDITETKLAEESLQIAQDQTRILKEIATAANVAPDVKHALEVALHQICDYTHWPVGHVYLPADDGTSDIVPSGIWHLAEPERFNTFKNITENTRFPSGIGLPGRILKTAKPVWITDVIKDANFPRAKQVKDIGVHGGFGFPVKVNGDVSAVFEFFSIEEEPPDETLLKLIEQIGIQLGYVIERKQAEKKLTHSEARQRAILEASLDPMVSIDSHGKILFVSDSVTENFGWSVEELIGQNVTKLMPAPFCDEHDGHLERYRRTGKTTILGRTRELIAVRKNGSTFPCEISVTKIKLPGEELLFTGILRDITERKEAEDKLRDNAQRLKLHAQHTPLGVIEWDLDFNITEWNSAAEKIFGFKREAVIGKSGQIIVPHNFKEQLDEVWNALISKKGGTQSTNENLTKSGKIITCDWYNTTLVGIEGNIIGAASLVQDITDRKTAEDELRRLATYDTLTNLPNRSLFDELLKHAIDSSDRTRQKHAVLFLDLDNFKNINDSLGHTIGDNLLKNVANRLADCMRKEDCVARFGGDEFVVLLNNISEHKNIAEIADKIINVLSSPFELDEKEIVVTSSIGIVIYPEDGITSQDLLRKADTALYQAKNSGRSNYQFFTNEMNLRVIKRMDMERRLRRGLSANEIIPYFQPKVDVSSGDIVGIEALARWCYADNNYISPATFIPVAEDSGLIISLDQHIITSALELASNWLQKGLSIPNIAFNLSTLQFKHSELIKFVDDLLAQYSFPDEFLEFEITEGTLMENSESAIKLMQKLYDRKISLTIDDFGTGYSSLSYLKRFPVDTLKIDISFIRDMTHSKKDRKMVASIISLAHNMEIKVVAEGVETEEQLKILKDFECDVVQGYLFSKPISAKSFEELIVSHQIITN